MGAQTRCLPAGQWVREARVLTTEAYVTSGHAGVPS